MYVLLLDTFLHQYEMYTLNLFLSNQRIPSLGSISAQGIEPRSRNRIGLYIFLGITAFARWCSLVLSVRFTQYGSEHAERSG